MKFYFVRLLKELHFDRGTHQLHSIAHYIPVDFYRKRWGQCLNNCRSSFQRGLEIDLLLRVEQISQGEVRTRDVVGLMTLFLAHFHSFLLIVFLCLPFILAVHAQVVGTTLLHESNIFYIHILNGTYGLCENGEKLLEAKCC